MRAKTRPAKAMSAREAIRWGSHVATGPRERALIVPPGVSTRSPTAEVGHRGGVGDLRALAGEEHTGHAHGHDDQPDEEQPQRPAPALGPAPPGAGRARRPERPARADRVGRADRVERWEGWCLLVMRAVSSSSRGRRRGP